MNFIIDIMKVPFTEEFLNERFTITPPKSHDKGGNVSSIVDKAAGEPPLISLPALPSWGAQEGQEASKSDPKTKVPNGKFTLSIIFPVGDYKTPESEHVRAQLKLLHRWIVKQNMINSVKWYGDEEPADFNNPKEFRAYEKRVCDFCKHPTDKKTKQPDLSKDETFATKLECFSGVWQTSVFNENKELLYSKNNVSDQTPNILLARPDKKPIMVSTIISPSGMWIQGGNTYTTFGVKQAMVYKSAGSLLDVDVCYVNTNDNVSAPDITRADDDEDIIGDEVSATIVDDSDDDKIDEDIHAVEPKVDEQPRKRRK